MSEAMEEERRGLVSSEVQTDELAAKHLAYPANLMYAQGMLTTTMLQMQLVELQIERLKEYLHQHELQQLQAKKEAKE